MGNETNPPSIGICCAPSFSHLSVALVIAGSISTIGGKYPFDKISLSSLVPGKGMLVANVKSFDAKVNIPRHFGSFATLLNALCIAAVAFSFLDTDPRFPIFLDALRYSLCLINS